MLAIKTHLVTSLELLCDFFDFAHINDVVQICCSSSDIILSSISKDLFTLTANKVVSILAFDDISAKLTLTSIPNELLRHVTLP